MLHMGDILEGRYQVCCPIGGGGTGRVYQVKDLKLGKIWALKEVVHGPYQGRVLKTEVRVLRDTQLSGVPRIVDLITLKEGSGIIMDYIRGVSLADLVRKEGPLSLERVIEYMISLSRIMGYFHQWKPPMIYRDCKPENVMLTPEGKIVLVDYGAVFQQDEESVSFGTPGFAAPEQYERCAKVDPRTDIYCLGAVMYYLLTGKRFSGTPEDLHRYQIGNSNHGKNYDESRKEAAGILMRCLAKEKDKRYSSMEILRQELVRAKKQNIASRNRRKMEKSIFYGLLAAFAVFLLTGTVSQGLQRRLSKKLAWSYVSLAEGEKGADKTESDFKKAVMTDPADGKIYQKVLDYYVGETEFTQQDEARLALIFGYGSRGRKPIDILKEKDQSAYQELCYDLGISYFYHMGGIRGRQEAGVWFLHYLELEEGKEERKKRAEAYYKISQYYKSFLMGDQYVAGEGEEKSYADFFQILHKLNKISIRKKSSQEDVTAAYQISKEVLLEITDHAEDFLREESISQDTLEEEIQKITQSTEDKTGRWDIMSARMNGEQMDVLKGLRDDAESTLVILQKSEGSADDGSYYDGEKYSVFEEDGND
ncbi:MAG: protein kinase [Lachnospiraceae bacterium]|nr:protein kinase [Lachnospiraceae bacterium]